VLAQEVEEEPDRLSLALPQPYLLFLGDTTEPGYAKTAFGLRDWARDKCIGEYSLPSASVSTSLPKLTPAEAHSLGARALVIGVANSGGFIADAWIPALAEALEAGLDIVSGMHARLADVPKLKMLADRLGRRLVDVRVPPANIPIATGLKRSGKRLLTVGTDCALGKKYTALSIASAFKTRGINFDFRATGQTGIMIAGGGMPMDAVVADFAAGAAEILSPAAAPDHWDVIEGQGSLLHPVFAGVTLSLLHGSQPDVFVVCHEPTRTHMRGLPHYPLPSLADCIDANVAAARLTNPEVRCAGISINTSALDASTADSLLKQTADAFGLPCVDPVRGGVAEIVDRL